MPHNSDPETISFNVKTIGGVLAILAVLVTLVLWVGTVNATGQQNSKDLTHQESEIELLKTQLSEMKIQLTVIQEQNKQLKTTLEEVRRDVTVIKNGK